MYARDRVHPQLHDTDSEKLMELYAHLRKESLATGSVPVTVRHFESTIRMAEASAKMHLRDVVTSSDINLAIKVTVGSFISAQKMSIKRTLERVRPRSCRNRFIKVSLIKYSSGVPEIHCT